MGYAKGSLADTLSKDFVLDIVEMKEQLEYIVKNYPNNLEAAADDDTGDVERT